MIQLSDLVLNLPGFCLNQINLVVEENDFFALIGPTGAGKSLVLEAVMGLMPVTSGRIRVNGRDVTCMPPESRGVGIVYQDYALFPHLNVKKNILYGVPYHHIPQKDVKKRLDFLVDCMNLRPLLLRHPQTLSGGEKQRVALARALILNPKVLLLDEPLSAVDPMLQDDLKEMLSRLHKELNATFVMVSHNFSDVFFLANRGAVINTGEIVQTGLVQELFEKPNSWFAAEFVGMKNIFPIIHKGSSCVTISQNGCDIEIATGSTRYIPEASHLAFRPEDITLSDVPPGTQFLEGTITALGAREFFYDVCIDAQGVQFTARCTRQTIVRQNLTPETRVFISILPDRLHFF